MAPIENVVLVGANGTLGPSVLHRLVSDGSFTVTVLNRASSKSSTKYASTVRTATVSDDFPVAELVPLLRGQDAVVVTFGGSNNEQQLNLAEAAAQAGVRRFVPADYGSVDSDSERARSLMPLYEHKTTARLRLMELAGRSGMSWTALVCGHFFDWCIREMFMHFDFENMKADILDDGTRRWSATTLDKIGLAVARVLHLEEETKNRKLFIQSLCVCQNDVLKAFERITGKDWQVTHLDSEEFIKENKKKADAGDAHAREEVIFALGVTEADWENQRDFANGLLGLENEDLEQAIRSAIGRPLLETEAVLENVGGGRAS